MTPEIRSELLDELKSFKDFHSDLKKLNFWNIIEKWKLMRELVACAIQIYKLLVLILKGDENKETLLADIEPIDDEDENFF